MTVPRTQRNRRPATVGSQAAVASQGTGTSRYAVPLWNHGDPQDAARQYAELRRFDPVAACGNAPSHALLAVTRYADVLAVLRDGRFAAVPPVADDAVPSRIEAAMGIAWLSGPSMATCDGADHRRLRRAVADWFRPDAVARLAPGIEADAARLLDAAVRREAFDLIGDFAAPLAVATMARVLGLTARAAGSIRRQLVAMTDAADRTARPARLLRRLRLARSLDGAVARAAPGSLVARLVRDSGEQDGVGPQEVLPMVLLLLFAGQETIISAIGNFALALSAHPDQWALLRHRPELIGPAVEELLRYAGPVESAGVRFAAADCMLAGVAIARGAAVAPVIASANRDAAEFDGADALDITRAPNPHIAFGGGTHHCLGAGLARLELRIALECLAARCPDLSGVAPRASVAWRRTRGLHGPARLPMQMKP